MTRPLKYISTIIILLFMVVSAKGQATSVEKKIPTPNRSKDILWDNGDFITHPGGGSGGSDISMVQDISVGLTTFGFGMQIGSQNSLADDFLVNGNWEVSTITFYGYQTGSGPPSTINEVRFMIYDDDPRAGGNVIYGDMTNNRLISSSWINAWRVQESNPEENRPLMEIVADANGLNLLPGVYWIEWQSSGSGDSGPWANPITILGQASTGNALQNNDGEWIEILDYGVATPQDFPFIIQGNLGPQVDNDLAAAKIISPVSGFAMGNEEVTVRIGNYGNNDQSNFEVRYTLDSLTTVTETVTETVLANTVYEYTFSQTVNLSEYGEHMLEVCTLLAGDEIPENDCLSEAITNAQALAVYPKEKEHWTGSTDGVTKTQNSLVHCLGGPDEVGWMKFDLSEVPEDEPITAVKFVGYVNETLFPFWSITPLPIDPITSSAEDIFNEIQAGTGPTVAYSYNNESNLFAPGWHTYPLGNGVLEDINNAVPQDWFAIGIGTRDNDPLFFLKFDGWNEANIPYLIVYYGDSASLCEPLYTTGCEWGDGFDDFILEDIINTGTACENNAGPGWSQYLGLGPAILYPGETYTVSMKTHYTMNFASMWIDFNDDMILGENEMVISNYAFPDTGVICQVEFTLPADANPGLHYMRARTRFNNGCNSPCDQYDYGEAEDYLVRIDEQISIEEMPQGMIHIFPNPVNDIVNIESEEIIKSVSIYDLTGQMLVCENQNKTRVLLNLAALPSAIYLLRIETGSDFISRKLIVK